MNPQIIAERDSSLILFESGKVRSVPNNLYNQVKYRENKGERILYTFNDDMKVHETYDNGIFNAFIKDETLQIRNSHVICESIIDHKKTGDTEKFSKLFKKLYFQSKKTELMKEMIDVFGDRVKTHTSGKENPNTYYVVDERFMVDDKGVSHYMDKKRHWKFLCTVAQGNLSKMTISTKIGTIELEAKELEIMGKIGFLLSPDITDSVFFHQLPEDLRDVLKAEVEFDSVNLGGT